MIELTFPVFGTFFPSDHNYSLYSALIRQDPRLKTIDWQLNTISGIPQNNGTIRLSDRSCFKIRCHLNNIPNFPTKIKVNRWIARVGTPTASEIPDDQNLYCRIATIKNAFTEETFIQSALKQLPFNTEITLGKRKIATIKRIKVVGFEVFLSTPDPKTVVTRGLGGRRRMGCGFFEKRFSKIKTESL